MNVEKIIENIEKTNLDNYKKDYLLNYINNTVKSNLPDETKQYKINKAVEAFQAYLTETEYNSLLIILKDSFILTSKDVVKPFDNIKRSIFFLTNPIILIIMTIIILSLLFYFRALKN